MMKIMKRHRDRLQLPSLWLRFHELYRGRFFRAKSSYAQVPVNLVFKTVNTLKANLTDNKPRVDLRPSSDASTEGAKAWQASVDDWWEQTDQQFVLQESTHNSELYGLATEMMRFDPGAEGGAGEVVVDLLDVFQTLFWPKAVDLQKSPMVAILDPMELAEIYRTWDIEEGSVKYNREYSDLFGEERDKIRGTQSTQRRLVGGQPGTDIPDYEPDSPGSDQAGRSVEVKRALVVKLWVKDYSGSWVDPNTGQEVAEGEELFAEQIDPATQQTVRVPIEPVWQSKYPGYIRFIAVTNNGELVLDDKPNPSINPDLPREVASQCYLWDKFPFIKRYSLSDGISEYGLSVVEQIEPLVIEISKKISKIAAHLDNSALPPLILPQACGVNRFYVTNAPSRIWEPVASLAAGIRFLDVPNLPQDYNEYIQSLLRIVEIITGLTDVSEGRRPTGVTSGVAIATLQEKAQIIIREKIRGIDQSVEEKGLMYVSLGQNWFTVQRILRTGDNNEEEIPFTGTDQIYQGTYRFKVEAGSTLPTNRWAQREQALKLFEGGALDVEALLEYFPEVTNKQALLMRLRAGPLGMAMQRLKDTGLFRDDELMQIEQLLSLSDADYEKFKKAEGPYFETRH
jgi:hypothetical protein